MDVSKRRRRAVRVRFWALLIIALTGYEYVLYRHWVESVPLLPTRVLELSRDDRPIGFIGRGDQFAVARWFEDPERRGGSDLTGPVSVYEFPGTQVTEVLTELDIVSYRLPLTGAHFSVHYDWSPIVYGRTAVAQDAFHADSRRPQFHVLDRERVLSLVDNILHCIDPATGRILWRCLDIESVRFIAGDLAYVVRRPLGFDVPDDAVVMAFLDLTSGTIVDLTEPVPAERGLWLDVSDISPDRRWISSENLGGISVWSVADRRTAWRKFYSDLGTRTLRFSSDSQYLVNSVIEQTGRVRMLRFRVSDGEPAPETEGERLMRQPSAPALAFLGRRYAMFQSRTRTPSDLARWLQTMASRWGFGTARAQSQSCMIVDVRTGRFCGIVDTTSTVLHPTVEANAFAIQRPSPSGYSLEFYSLPPRADWTWWILRGILVPLAATLLASRLHRKEIAEAELDWRAKAMSSQHST